MERIFRPNSPIDWIFSTILLPFSWLYAGGWTIYFLIYKLGLKKRKQFKIPIVCVGNLEVGGTGKTPVAIEVARILMKTGKKVAVSVNGYGSPARNKSELISNPNFNVSDYGDEAGVISNQLPEVGLIVGKNRVNAAELAEKKGYEVLVLDDGFQHLPLARNVDLLLVNPKFQNKRCLPAGPMREPKWAINRATATLCYSCSEAKFSISRKYLGFENIFSKEVENLEWIQGKKVSAVCGIGQPTQFFEAIARLGAILETKIAKPDHAASIDIPDTGTWIVTEKDKDKTRTKNTSVYVLKMKAEFDNEEEFTDWLTKKLLE